VSGRGSDIIASVDERRFLVGERVLASRAEDGQGHEEGTVVDSYQLLMNGEARPMVVVGFADGERKWMTASAPNVLAIEADEGDGPVGADAARAGDAVLEDAS
jgi:hypothetical protein